MGETLRMSAKERQRLVELESVSRGEQSLAEAARRLGLSYRQAKRSWRPPKEAFGEIVQFDGSHHDWFERGSGSQDCLMGMIDDATKRRLASMGEEETTADKAYGSVHGTADAANSGVAWRTNEMARRKAGPSRNQGAVDGLR